MAANQPPLFKVRTTIPVSTWFAGHSNVNGVPLSGPALAVDSVPPNVRAAPVTVLQRNDT